METVVDTMQITFELSPHHPFYARLPPKKEIPKRHKGYLLAARAGNIELCFSFFQNNAECLLHLPFTSANVKGVNSVLDELENDCIIGGEHISSFLSRYQGIVQQDLFHRIREAFCFDKDYPLDYLCFDHRQIGLFRERKKYSFRLEKDVLDETLLIARYAA